MEQELTEATEWEISVISLDSCSVRPRQDYSGKFRIITA